MITALSLGIQIAGKEFNILCVTDTFTGDTVLRTSIVKKTAKKYEGKKYKLRLLKGQVRSVFARADCYVGGSHKEEGCPK